VGLVPFLVGALTVYLARDRRPSLGYAAVAPLIPVMMFVAGTAILLIEGSICIAMALPLFLIVAMIGGVVMWGVLKFYRPSSATMGAFLLLPLLGGWGERGLPLPDRFGRSVSSVHIDAPPEAIWHLINDAHDIQPAEMRGWAWAIGVPHPVSAKTVETDGRRVRKLRWEKGVHFDEPILDWQENRYVRWRYAFAGDSIPPGALDDHVRIGGRYFDLIDTSYRLAPEAGGTRLSIEVDYRVSTNFNFYAGWWADKLVGDAARTILGFYKRRTEAHS
jgi:hypothetical protein